MTKKNKNRQFIFIDESGDVGFSNSPSSSKYFQLNILVVDSEGLEFLTSEIERYRYFLDRKGELKKRVHFKDKKLFDLIVKILDDDKIDFYHSRIIKAEYQGPYKNNQFRLREFLIKKTLQKIEKITESHGEQEIIIDRYIDSEPEKKKLEKYLNDGYKLPRFLHISSIDSRYCYPLQFLDVFETFFKYQKIDRQKYLIDLEIESEKK